MQEFMLNRFLERVIMMACVFSMCSCGSWRSIAEPINQEVTTTALEVKPGPPLLVFESPMYDFGRMVKGEVKRHEYKFHNLGTEDLIIEIATGCDCTTIDYPTLPIKSGESGVIKIVFNSAEKELGAVTVDVDIIANTQSIVTTAQFKAVIVPPNN